MLATVVRTCIQKPRTHVKKPGTPKLSWNVKGEAFPCYYNMLSSNGCPCPLTLTIFLLCLHWYFPSWRCRDCIGDVVTCALHPTFTFTLLISYSSPKDLYNQSSHCKWGNFTWSHNKWKSIGNHCPLKESVFPRNKIPDRLSPISRGSFLNTSTST